MKFNKLKAFWSLLILLESQVFASTLIIQNDDHCSELEVIIEPGEGSFLSSTPQIKRILKPSEKVTMTGITPEKLGNVGTFSVIGKVTMPSLYNRCTGLFFDKNYTIVFSPTKTGGVVCHHTETKEDKTDHAKHDERERRERAERKKAEEHSREGSTRNANEYQ